MKQHIYIIGSKGIPAKYGGFETFVEKLTKGKQNNDIYYHVACIEDNSLKSNIKESRFIYNNSDCFNIKVPNIGPARAIYYDVVAIKYAIEDAKKNKYDDPIFYILACRMGPFMRFFVNKIHKIGGKVFLNPDGHEWMRGKWSYPVQQYWKFSERLMVKYSDLIICDSLNVEKYIQNQYLNYCPKTTYIAYGTDIPNNISTSSFIEWYQKYDVEIGNYYLIVGRFVPENNYLTIIREFMKSNTDKDLVIITNIERNKFYHFLEKETHFSLDKRIKFVGTVYNQELLTYIRQNAFAYIHGHEVGGTNPSLLESLATTPLNLLFDVGFNQEVGQDGALYWSKNSGDLSNVISQLEEMDEEKHKKLQYAAKDRVKKAYTWGYIIKKYEQIFLVKD